ncbi:hypothetical protein [Mycetocola zhadangensis]|uniref:hypothetical protein n=1 Tax=Mycetocola zhadangensis TaxID=1164595 RepID=UPI001600506F|nr:hypothetical protein [Mycetocola zhadangensis]
MTAVLALLPLMWNRRFYFQDDTENGAFGVWFHLGQSLTSGKIPVLDPSVWSSGNFLAEGQWGTWNPLMMLLGVMTYLGGNAVATMTAIKISFLVLASVGVFLLARSYGARPELAFVGGVAVTLNGFTVYFDSPSWVTGLIVWALIPYFWLMLRRLVLGADLPLWAFLSGYLIVTVGYLQGTFAIGFVLLAVGIDALLRRAWPSAWKVVGVGLALVLVAVTVFLPGVLTGSVTNRAVSVVGNDGMMATDIAGLLSSTLATAFPQVASWWWTGPTATSPMLYIAWFLPVLCFVDWKRAVAGRALIRDVAIVLVLATAYVLLPTVIGPLRYPVRFMPYVALAAILLSVILLSRWPAPRMSKQRLIAALAIIAIGAYLAWAQLPSHLLALLAAFACASVGVFLVWFVLRTNRWRQDGTQWGRVAGVVATIALMTTLIQHHDTPASPLSKNNVPADTSIAKSVLQDLPGDVLVVGDPTQYGGNPAAWRETSMANSWYLSPARVQNRYQLIGFAAYNSALCLQYLGGTCPELLDSLFERRATGLLLVDQLSINSLQILKTSVPASAWESPPPGWRVVSDEGLTAEWTRIEPIPPAGGVVWTSEGTEVETIGISDTEINLRVVAVPSNGGTVAFSRLAWPGYFAENADLTRSPVDGFLLGVDVPGGRVGDTVTITFRPPGWHIEVAAFVLAVMGVAGWAVAVFLRRRNDRIGRSDESDRGVQALDPA